MRKNRVLFVLFSVVLAAAFMLSACTSTPAVTEEPVEEPVVEEEVEEEPVEEPVTEAALGTAENPIVMALAPSATAEQLTVGGDAVAAKLTELTGYTYEVIIPNSYTALIEAMASNNAHFGWMPTFAYLLAKNQGAAEVALVVVRNGSDFYGAQYVANVAAGFTPYFDSETNTNTADAATALAQFDGKRPCFTDPLSVSGYIIPSGLLAQYGVNYKTPAAVQGHPAVIRALYAGGICDFGTTYIDARTSVSDLADVNEKIVVIWRTDAIIPNDNVSFSALVPADIKEAVTQALLDMADSEEGREILKSMGYEVQGLKVAEDSFYDAFRVALEASGYDYTSAVK